MFNESELITHFDSIYNFAEVLALKVVREIQIPVCSSLIQLTSTDCLKLMVSIFIILLYIGNSEKIHTFKPSNYLFKKGVL
jgi:hypothetical protein